MKMDKCDSSSVQVNAAMKKFRSTLLQCISILKAKRVEVANYCEQIDHLSSENSRLILEKTELERQLKEKQASEAATALRLQQQNDQCNRQYEEQINWAKAKHAADEETIRSLCLQLSKAATEEGLLKKRLAQAESFAESHRIASDRMDDLLNSVNTLRSQMSALSREHLSIAQELDSVRDARQLLQAHEQRHKFQRKLLQDKIDRITAEMQAAIANQLELQCEFAKVQTESDLRIASLTCECNELQRKLTQKSQEVDQLTADFKALHSMTDTLARNLEKSQIQNELLRLQNDKLKMTMKTETATSRSTGSHIRMTQ